MGPEVTRANLRILWYYSVCLSCNSPGIRRLKETGTAMPCDVCEVGFRLVVGRRELWDDDNGTRQQSFISAVVQHAKKGPPTDIIAKPADPSLSAEEMEWLFGLDKKR